MDEFQQGAFTSTDAGEATEVLTRLVGRAEVRAPAREAFHFELSWTVAGPLGARYARVGNSSTVQMGIDAPHTINVAQVGRGRMMVRSRRSRFGIDGVPHLMPQEPFTSTMEATGLTIVALDRSWVQDYAAELLQREDFRLHFSDATPRSPAAAEHWTATVKHLRQDVLGNDEAMSIPLIRAEASRRAATALLRCFPGTFHDHDPPGAETTSLPGPVHRAVAFIDEHLDQPLGLTEIATAARTSPHGLVTAFRRHLDTTPRDYLCSARLDAVHLDLQAADPADGQTVAVIARRWGFTDLARFTTDYRTHYGCTPTSTLQS